MLLFATAASMFAVDRIETPLSRNDFEKRYKSSMPSQLKALLESDTVTALEKEGLRFMYAYMTLPDIMDRTPQYYLQNIRGAIRASEEMPWGKDVPDREFRHFVLSPRVNNENLDDSRDYLYAELKDRIKGMSMEDAILEVNHWCHEKRLIDLQTDAPTRQARQYAPPWADAERKAHSESQRYAQSAFLLVRYILRDGHTLTTITPG